MKEKLSTIKSLEELEILFEQNQEIPEHLLLIAEHELATEEFSEKCFSVVYPNEIKGTWILNRGSFSRVFDESSRVVEFDIETELEGSLQEEFKALSQMDIQSMDLVGTRLKKNHYVVSHSEEVNFVSSDFEFRKKSAGNWDFKGLLMTSILASLVSPNALAGSREEQRNRDLEKAGFQVVVEKRDHKEVAQDKKGESRQDQLMEDLKKAGFDVRKK